MAFNQGVKAILPFHAVQPRYLQYAIISNTERLKALGSGSTFLELGNEPLAQLSVPNQPVAEQRRIAEFLDDRVARIDQIIAARREQIGGHREIAARWALEAVSGRNVIGPRKPVAAWLGDVPETWPVLTVGTEFQVDLGKMLDEKRQSRANEIPYLRNTNVQWDVVATDHLKSMDIDPHERDRYTVRAGDLLICEGGQPGRAAIWRGEINPLGFQKALHRARSRGRSDAAWLLECLRAAAHLNVFSVETGQTTIGHLTNEQLRSTRFPFPERVVQGALLAELNERRTGLWALSESLGRSIVLLQEYKQSLITAAVTGEFDVTTASTRIPE